MNKNVSLIVLFFISLTLTLVGCSKKEPDSTQTQTAPPILAESTISETLLSPLILTPLNDSSDIGVITFSQNDETIFYYDAKSKRGKIILNGIEYILSEIEGSYKLSGDNVNITTTQGEWEDTESEDCGYKKSLVVTIKMGTQVLELNNVEVQHC